MAELEKRKQVIPSRLDNVPQDWEVKRYGNALRPVSADSKKADKVANMISAGSWLALGAFFFAPAFGLSSAFSSIFLMTFIATIILGITMKKKNEQNVIPVYNKELVEIVKSGHRSRLLDRMIERNMDSILIDPYLAIELWGKSEDVGGTFAIDVHNMLIGMVDEATNSRRVENPTNRASGMLVGFDLVFGATLDYRKNTHLDFSESTQNRQIKTMLQKVDEILLEKKKAEAAAAGVNPDSIANPVDYNFNRALESAKHEAELLKSVTDELKGTQNRFKN